MSGLAHSLVTLKGLVYVKASNCCENVELHILKSHSL